MPPASTEHPCRPFFVCAYCWVAVIMRKPPVKSLNRNHHNTIHEPAPKNKVGGPSRAEPARDKPSRAEPGRAGPSRAKASRAEPIRAGPRRPQNHPPKSIFSPPYGGPFWEGKPQFLQ